MKRKLTITGAGFALLASAMFFATPSRAKSTADLKGNSVWACRAKAGSDCIGPMGIFYNHELVDIEQETL